MMATMARVTRLLFKEWEGTVDTKEIKDLVAEAEKKEETMGTTIQDRVVRLFL